MIVGVLLAAGRGRRLGGPKSRLVRGGRPVLDALVEAYRAGGIEHLAVSWPRGVAPRHGPIGVRWAPTDPDLPMSAALAGALAALEATIGDRAQGALVQPRPEGAAQGQGFLHSLGQIQPTLLRGGQIDGDVPQRRLVVVIHRGV